MEADLTHRIATLVLQLAVILVTAKLAAEAAERWLGQPAVVGEILAGAVIGPYALGAVTWPAGSALFPVLRGPLPVSVELYAFGQIAAVVLLFLAGLETDRALFVRHLGAATLVGLGGVVLPFAAGAGASVLAGLAPGFTHPTALFVGAVMTATSVGITARVLGDLRQLGRPEAVTVLAAAVVDDVLAIIALALALDSAASDRPSAVHLLAVGAKATSIWIALTVGFTIGARWLERIVGAFRGQGATLGLALGLVFLAAYLAEAFGLAMIIGAYSAGLGLSGRPLAHRLLEALRPLSDFIVPIFFVLMGMLVDLGSVRHVLFFGIALSVLAVLTKVIGCAGPALVTGFNTLGAARIGIGMLPRGEVALIIASVGLAAGAIDTAIFGVAVMLTLVTTILAPILLVPLFRLPRAGLRRP